jgi:O-antigen/teichoic acid export membrane protein
MADLPEVTEGPAEEQPRRIQTKRGVLVFDWETISEELLPWATKGGLALVDQGFISGSNFLISILLARWLLPGQYGAYAIAYGVFLLLSMLYGSLLLEPMGVFGGAAYRGCLRGYLGALLWIHLVIAVLIFSLLGVSAGVARVIGQGNGLPGALAGVTVAAPCILLFWLARRTFYVELSPARAAIGSALYCAVVLGALFLLYRYGLLSPFTAFLLMGLGSLATGVLLLFYLKSTLQPSASAPSVRQAWKRHWEYGRWALAGNVASWVPAYIFYPLLSGFHTLAQAGQLRALMNFVLPLAQTQAALSMLLIPYAARVNARAGKSGSAALAVKVTLLSAAATLAYWAVIIPFRGPVFRFLYHGQYSEFTYLIPIVAIGSVFWAAAYGSSILLRAMESPDSIFAAFCAATVISLVVGVPATWALGLSGAVWAITLSDVASFFMVVYLLRRKVAGASIEPGSPLAAKVEAGGL